MQSARPGTPPPGFRAPAPRGAQTLEIELQSQLDDPAVFGRQYLPKCAGITPNIRGIEVGMIERIEELRPKLQRSSFPKPKRLRETEIKVRQSRPAHDSDTGITRSLRSRSKRLESVRVEPAFDSAFRRWQHRIPDQV